MKLLITSPAYCAPAMQGIVDRAKTLFEEVVLNPFKRTMTIDELKELWNGVDAVVAGLEPYTPDVLAQAPSSLKAIVRFGVGYDTVDVPAAAKAGIKVSNTPGTMAKAVAELTFGLMLAAARRIPQWDHNLRAGQWGRYVGVELAGKTLGIMGMGLIGKQVAKRAAAFEMDIVAYDPFFDAAFAAEYGIKQVSMDGLLSASDFITLHMPASAENQNLINDRTLGLMKKTAFLINAARGALVDEDALYRALSSGQIMGAGLDVFQQEPLGDSPLLKLENIVLLPHLGGHTGDANLAMGNMALDRAAALARGEGDAFAVKA